MCVYHVFSIHLPVDGHLDCFHFLAVMNSAAINMAVQMSHRQTDFISLEYIPSSWIAGSHGNSVSNFLRNFHIIYHNGYINFHSHQLFARIPFSPHPCQHLLCFVFLIMANWSEVIFHFSFDLYSPDD